MTHDVRDLYTDKVGIYEFLASTVRYPRGSELSSRTQASSSPSFASSMSAAGAASPHSP
jgi:hypothetical protein